MRAVFSVSPELGNYLPRMFRKIPNFFINLLSVYSANAINGILGIIAVPLVVAALGNEQYGIYSIYAILASYVALIDFGVTKHFVRLMSSVREASKQAEYLQKAFGWYLALSIILICLSPALIYAVVHYLFPVKDRFISDVKWIVVLSIIDYVLAIPTMLIKAYTLSNQVFKRYSSYISISNGLKYGLMFLAAWIYKNPTIVVLFLVSRRLFDLIFAYLILPKPPKAAWHPRINISEFKNILANSSIMSLSQVIQTTIVSIGAILVNRHFGVATMGNYRAAFDLSSKVWFFSNGIGLVVFPKFSQILSDRTERESLYRKMSLWLEKSFTGYLLIASLAIVCASWLLPLMQLGDEQIILYFKLLIFGICLNAHTNVSYEYLLADNRYGTVALLSSGVLFIIIFSYFLLIGIAGPYAIGWAWIISQTVFAFTTDELIVKKKFIFGKNWWVKIVIKIGIFSLTLLCLFVEVGLSSIQIHIIAPVVFVTCIGLLLKDIKELKLFFQ